MGYNLSKAAQCLIDSSAFDVSFFFLAHVLVHVVTKSYESHSYNVKRLGGTRVSVHTKCM